MPLSEHEQKMLDEMERQLFADDPRLAHAFRGSERPPRSMRRVGIGIAIALAGLIVLVAAVLIPFVPLGVVGFAAMVGGAIYAITAPTRPSSPEDSDAPSAGQSGPVRQHGPAPRSGFVQRMEERWDRRSGDGGL